MNSCPVSGPVAIVCAHKHMKEAWNKAVAYEGVSTSKTVVSFSPTNPYVPLFDEAEKKYRELLNAARE